MMCVTRAGARVRSSTSRWHPDDANARRDEQGHLSSSVRCTTPRDLKESDTARDLGVWDVTRHNHSRAFPSIAHEIDDEISIKASAGGFTDSTYPPGCDWVPPSNASTARWNATAACDSRTR
jgi:hypothetical protein